MNFLQPSLHLFLESDLRQTALNVVRFERVSTYTSERMVHEEIHIPNQGHTLACMIRDLLFEHGANFGACVAPHPQSSDLRVDIEADDCKACLRASLHEARLTVENCLKAIEAKVIHDEAIRADEMEICG